MRPILLAAGLALLGCATKSDMRGLPSDAGTAKTYDAPFDRVRRACQDALAADGFKISESEKDTRFVEPKVYQMMASQGISAGTVGRRVRVRIENKDAQCAVWVAVRSKVDSRDAEPTDNLLAEDLHKKIAERLAK